MHKLKEAAICAAVSSGLGFFIGYMSGYAHHDPSIVEKEVCCYDKASISESACMKAGGIPFEDPNDVGKGKYYVLKECVFPPTNKNQNEKK
jgi:hypothetical protein